MDADSHFSLPQWAAVSVVIHPKRLASGLGSTPAAAITLVETSTFGYRHWIPLRFQLDSSEKCTRDVVHLQMHGKYIPPRGHNAMHHHDTNIECSDVCMA
jgi:hypothetical protein